MTRLADRIGADATAAVQGLWQGLRYLRGRPLRTPRARIWSAGGLELLALAILAGSMIAASMILLDPLTAGIRMRMPLSVVHFFERITALGLGGVVLWPVGLALLAVLAVKPRLDDMGRRVTAALAARIGFLFVSIAGAGLLVLVVKYLLGRPRPYTAVQLGGENAHLVFDWLALKANFASFPSGHSSIAFATAVAFGALFPRARVPLILLAFLVASSRVVLGSHYPSDVLAGGVVASVFVLLTVKAFAARRIVFSVSADGTISPMPGPSPRRLARLMAPAAPARALDEARS